MPDSVSYHIPAEDTLVRGLASKLQDVAQWRTDTQLVLSVNDAIRISAAIHNHGALDQLIGLLDQVGASNEFFPIDVVIEQAIALGAELWGTQEGAEASQTLYTICRHYGANFSANQVWRMVVRDESVSRTGLNGLGILYDVAFEHTVSLDLIRLFLSHSDRRIAFYCYLREQHRGDSFLAFIRKQVGVEFADVALHSSIENDLLNKWANRANPSFSTIST